MTSKSRRVWFGKAVAMATLAAGLVSFAGSAYADRISNPVAVFAGLDKITGRVTSFDVYINETVQFGALQVTPRVCYSRDDKEAQQVDGFVEVDEITLDRKIRRIFTGWMFAANPGLNAVEHPIYDVWLTGCKLTSDIPRPTDVKLPDPTPQPDPAEQKNTQAQQGQTATPATQGQPAPQGQTPAATTAPQANIDAQQAIPGQESPASPAAGDMLIPGDTQQPAENQAPGDNAPQQPQQQPTPPLINGTVPKSPGLF